MDLITIVNEVTRKLSLYLTGDLECSNYVDGAIEVLSSSEVVGVQFRDLEGRRHQVRAQGTSVELWMWLHDEYPYDHSNPSYGVDKSPARTSRHDQLTALLWDLVYERQKTIRYYKSNPIVLADCHRVSAWDRLLEGKLLPA